MELMVKPHYLDTSETVNSYSKDFLISRPISNKEHADELFSFKCFSAMKIGYPYENPWEGVLRQFLFFFIGNSTTRLYHIING